MVDMLSPTSSRRTVPGPKVDRTRQYSSSVGNGVLKNSGLPKGREAQGNGALIVVDKKTKGGSQFSSRDFDAANYTSGIEALKHLADGNFLTVKNIYRII